MKKHLIATAALCTLLSGAAFAQQATDGPWLVRARAVSLTSANTDTTGNGLTINNKWIPEVDISYFFTKNISAELVLTVPQTHNISSNGTQIGTLSELPPTLLAQYHFDANGYSPYVGAGVNYTQFSEVSIANGAVTLDSGSWGGALQAGVDIPMGGNMVLNFDVKKVYIKTNVNVGGTSIGTFQVDPVLVGMGVGWRF